MTPTMIQATEAVFAVNMFEEFPDVGTQFNGTPSPRETRAARFWVMPNPDVTPLGLGRTTKSRNLGIVYMDVTGPKDEGAGETADLAWKMSGWFKDLELPTSEGVVTFKRGAVVDQGTIGERQTQRVTVPYRYDFS